MKKEYEKVKIEVVKYCKDDCMTSSGVGVQWDSEWNGYLNS